MEPRLSWKRPLVNKGTIDRCFGFVLWWRAVLFWNFGLRSCRFNRLYAVDVVVHLTNVDPVRSLWWVRARPSRLGGTEVGGSFENRICFPVNATPPKVINNNRIVRAGYKGDCDRRAPDQSIADRPVRCYESATGQRLRVFRLEATRGRATRRRRRRRRRQRDVEQEELGQTQQQTFRYRGRGGWTALAHHRNRYHRITRRGEVGMGGEEHRRAPSRDHLDVRRFFCGYCVLFTSPWTG